MYKIKDVIKVDIGHINYEILESMDNFLHGCPNLNEAYVNDVYAPKLRSLNGLLSSSRNLEKVQIYNFTAPSLNSLNYMFDHCGH